MSATAVYRLPKAFASDHWDRGCGHTDEVVRVTKSHYYVKMDQDGWGDMESDADYYVYCGSDMGWEYQGLVSSARATLAALRKQGPPEPVEPTTEDKPATCGCDARWICADHVETATA